MELVKFNSLRKVGMNMEFSKFSSQPIVNITLKYEIEVPSSGQTSGCLVFLLIFVIGMTLFQIQTQILLAL